MSATEERSFGLEQATQLAALLPCLRRGEEELKKLILPIHAGLLYAALYGTSPIPEDTVGLLTPCQMPFVTGGEPIDINTRIRNSLENINKTIEERGNECCPSVQAICYRLRILLHIHSKGSFIFEPSEQSFLDLEVEQLKKALQEKNL